jgi:hypothetical protein
VQRFFFVGTQRRKKGGLGVLVLGLTAFGKRGLLPEDCNTTKRIPTRGDMAGRYGMHFSPSTGSSSPQIGGLRSSSAAAEHEK